LTEICEEKVSSSIPEFSLGVLMATFEGLNCGVGVERVDNGHNWNQGHVHQHKEERRDEEFVILYQVMIIALGSDEIGIYLVLCGYVTPKIVPWFVVFHI